MTTLNYILLCFIGSLFIDKGACIQCYQCDSTTDPDCKENLDYGALSSLSISSTDCAVDSSKFCIKTIGVWGGVVGTRRFCSSRDMSNQCQFITYPDHDRPYRACIYTCLGNACNAADRTIARASLSALCSGVLMTFIFILKSFR